MSDEKPIFKSYFDLGIKPFNEVYYKSCYYNPLISTILWCKKSFNPLMANEVFAYTENSAKTIGVSIKSHFGTYEKKMLERMGIYLENIDIDDETIIGNIKKHIENNTPVMIEVDSLSYPKLTYYISDVMYTHYMLITGYNNQKGEFKIIETISQTEETSITYDLLRKCYFNLKDKGAAFLIKNNAAISSGEEFSRQDYVHHLKKSGDEIMKGFVKLQDAIQNIRNLDGRMELNGTKDNPENLFFEFYEIVKTKNLEKYKTEKLFETQEFSSRYDSLMDYWGRVKNLITKYVIFNDKALLQSAAERAQEAIQLEVNLYNGIYKFIEETN